VSRSISYENHDGKWVSVGSEMNTFMPLRKGIADDDRRLIAADGCVRLQTNSEQAIDTDRRPGGTIAGSRSAADAQRRGPAMPGAARPASFQCEETHGAPQPDSPALPAHPTTTARLPSTPTPCCQPHRASGISPVR
jgi:hypothetical protein